CRTSASCTCPAVSAGTCSFRRVEPALEVTGQRPQRARQVAAQDGVMADEVVHPVPAERPRTSGVLGRLVPRHVSLLSKAALARRGCIARRRLTGRRSGGSLLKPRTGEKPYTPPGAVAV